MDAGLAAVIGALIGALAAPVSQFLIRRSDRADREQQRHEDLRERQRSAIVDVADAVNGLIEHPGPHEQSLAAARRLTLAVTQLDLVIESEDADLVSALKSAASAFTILQTEQTQKVIAAWVGGAAAWLRNDATATDVRRVVDDLRQE